MLAGELYGGTDPDLERVRAQHLCQASVQTGPQHNAALLGFERDAYPEPAEGD
jgi:hypothetical protein